jgi:hypothetical protein
MAQPNLIISPIGKLDQTDPVQISDHLSIGPSHLADFKTSGFPGRFDRNDVVPDVRLQRPNPSVTVQVEISNPPEVWFRRCSRWRSIPANWKGFALLLSGIGLTGLGAFADLALHTRNSALSGICFAFSCSSRCLHSPIGTLKR